MKKRVIAIGASTIALATLPVIGVVSAETGLSSTTDIVQVTVEEGCTFVADPESQTDHSVTLGQGSVVKDIEGVTFNVTCNGRDYEGSWEITAQGGSEGMLSDGEHNIQSQAGGELGGEESNWAFKMEVTGAAQVSEGYLDYAQVPYEAPVTVATNTGEQATEDATVRALYGVSVNATQEEGTYRGEVVYTLTNTAPEM